MRSRSACSKWPRISCSNSLSRRRLAKKSFILVPSQRCRYSTSTGCRRSTPFEVSERRSRELWYYSIHMSTVVTQPQQTTATDQIKALEREYVLQNYARYPIILHKGKGCYAYDIDGKRYLDLIAG